MTGQRIGLGGAVAIGLGSMLGAGVFTVWQPAAAIDGAVLMPAVVIAGAVALLNAFSTAQLAAEHPVAGGAYTFGRREISPTWGFIAGAGFVLGKTASVAAIALAVGATVPLGLDGWGQRAVAAVCLVAAWFLNSRGITRTALVATIIAAVVIVVLVVTGAIALTGEQQPTWDGGTPEGIAGAAALIFFAFAGYARVATLGEEVTDPARTIPRAIAIALGATLALYLFVALAVTRTGADAAVAPWTSGGPLVLLVAAVAAFGSLVALMAGIGRTGMAMAREADLPTGLAATNSRGVPARAEGVSALAALVLVAVGSLGFAIAVSSVAVLLYYLVANVAAVRQRRRGGAVGFSMPWVLSVLGAVACGALIMSLPLGAVVVAGVALAALAGVRAVTRRLRSA